MPNNITQAKKQLEQKFDAISKQTVASLKSYLEGKKKELVAEIDDQVRLAQELPGIDLSQYQEVRKFTYDWPYVSGAVQTIKIGDRVLPINVVIAPQSKYEGFFLLRKVEPKTQEGKKA